jgi:hypothetical protein
MTADELEQTLTKFAERAVTAIVPRPRIRIAVERIDDDGHSLLSGDVNFMHDGSDRGERAAERALDVLNKIVDADDRMEFDENGSGDEVAGLTVTVELT